MSIADAAPSPRARSRPTGSATSLEKQRSAPRQVTEYTSETLTHSLMVFGTSAVRFSFNLTGLMSHAVRLAENVEFGARGAIREYERQGCEVP